MFFYLIYFSAKRNLSENQEAKIEISPFFNDENLSEILTRSKFQDINLDLFKKTLVHIEKGKIIFENS